MFQKLHHVAYRCRDAQETVDFYTKVLGLKYAAGEASPEGHKPYGEDVDLGGGEHAFEKGSAVTRWKSRRSSLTVRIGQSPDGSPTPNSAT